MAKMTKESDGLPISYKAAFGAVWLLLALAFAGTGAVEFLHIRAQLQAAALRLDAVHIALCLCMVILAGIAWIFAWRIYRPLRAIEDALTVFQQHGENFSVSIDRHSAAYPIAHRLNSIHAELHQSIAREYTARMKQQDAEIHALQSQINPHFLYNTLDAIRGLALLHDDEPVADMTEALSTFFRYSIGQKGFIVTLQDELDNIRNYLTIQDCRFRNKLSMQIEIDDPEPEQVLQSRIPKLILQPIIENSVFHGIEPKIGKGTIRIRIFRTQDALFINVQDDGVGMDEVTLSGIQYKLQQGLAYTTSQISRGGIALVNINQRILLNYGDRYGMTISSVQGCGCEVELILPLLTDDKSGRIYEEPASQN